MGTRAPPQGVQKPKSVLELALERGKLRSPPPKPNRVKRQTPIGTPPVKPTDKGHAKRRAGGTTQPPGTAEKSRVPTPPRGEENPKPAPEVAREQRKAGGTARAVNQRARAVDDDNTEETSQHSTAAEAERLGVGPSIGVGKCTQVLGGNQRRQQRGHP